MSTATSVTYVVFLQDKWNRFWKWLWSKIRFGGCDMSIWEQSETLDTRHRWCDVTRKATTYPPVCTNSIWFIFMLKRVGLRLPLPVFGWSSQFPGGLTWPGSGVAGRVSWLWRSTWRVVPGESEGRQTWLTTTNRASYGSEGHSTTPMTKTTRMSTNTLGWAWLVTWAPRTSRWVTLWLGRWSAVTTSTWAFKQRTWRLSDGRWAPQEGEAITQPPHSTIKSIRLKSQAITHTLHHRWWPTIKATVGKWTTWMASPSGMKPPSSLMTPAATVQRWRMWVPGRGAISDQRKTYRPISCWSSRPTAIPPLSITALSTAAKLCPHHVPPQAPWSSAAVMSQEIVCPLPPPPHPLPPTGVVTTSHQSYYQRTWTIWRLLSRPPLIGTRTIWEKYLRQTHLHCHPVLPENLQEPAGKDLRNLQKLHQLLRQWKTFARSLLGDDESLKRRRRLGNSVWFWQSASDMWHFKTPSRPQDQTAN